MLVYDSPFLDGIEVFRAPNSPESALTEFHSYMQKRANHTHDSYVVVGLFDTYADISRNQIKRDYPIKETSNPDLTIKRKIKEDLGCTLFDDAEVVDESKRAKIRKND